MFVSMDVLITGQEIRGYQLFGSMVVWERERKRIYM